MISLYSCHFTDAAPLLPIPWAADIQIDGMNQAQSMYQTYRNNEACSTLPMYEVMMGLPILSQAHK